MHTESQPGKSDGYSFEIKVFLHRLSNLLQNFHGFPLPVKKVNEKRKDIYAILYNKPCSFFQAFGQEKNKR